MAVNYSNLFEGVGEHIQKINDYRGYFTDLDTDQSQLETDMTAIGRLDVYSGTPEMIVGFKQQLLGWVSQIRSKIDALLTHRTTILEELAVGNSTDIQTVLAQMIRDMNDNAVTFGKSTVTIGSPTNDCQNSNVGVLLLGKVLDGYSAPSNRSQANREYMGLDSELAVSSETMTFTCIRDSESGGTSEGSEIWQWLGDPNTFDQFHWNNRGSGDGPTITGLNANTYLSNLGFETFTVANTPDSWTIVTGTAGTHIFSETGAGNIYGGSKSLKLLGNASLAAIELTQAFTVSGLNPARRYCLAAWVKGNASLAAGTLELQLTGTGYTPGATEKISLNLAALQAQTSFGEEYCFINLPDDIPSDLKVQIKLSGTPSAHAIYIDGLAFGPVVWHGGIHASIITGKNKFLKGDRIKVAVSNNESGVVQTYFGKAYGVQLPSSGTPSITDASVID